MSLILETIIIELRLQYWANDYYDCIMLIVLGLPSVCAFMFLGSWENSLNAANRLSIRAHVKSRPREACIKEPSVQRGKCTASRRLDFLAVLEMIFAYCIPTSNYFSSTLPL